MSLLKQKLHATAVAVCLAMASFNAQADIGSAMNDAFNSMSNYTRPGVFETQRRGVVAGGSYYEREPVVSTDILSLQLPSVRAGCGGIDFFGGSFSFINADQFVQLLRAIAANAKGYAFQIALSYASELIGDKINFLQSIIQKMNDAFGNSCRLAEGLVTDTANALGADIRNRSSLTGTINGLFQDIGQAYTSSNGTDVIKAQNDLPDGAKEDLIGNVVWQELKRNDVRRLIVSASANENHEYEQLMSISGTAVIGKAQDSGDGNQSNPVQMYAPLITLDDLVEGAENKQVYTCNDADDGCTKIAITTSDIPSLKDTVLQALIGNSNDENANGGILGKFAQYQNNQFTDAEGSVASNMLPGTAAMIRNLAINNPQLGREVATDFANAIAMDWSYNYIKRIITLARLTANVSKLANRKEVVDQMNDALNRLDSDYQRLITKYPSYSALTAKYAQVMKIVHLSDMMISTAEGNEIKVNQ